MHRFMAYSHGRRPATGSSRGGQSRKETLDFSGNDRPTMCLYELAADRWWFRTVRFAGFLDPLSSTLQLPRPAGRPGRAG